MIIAHNAVLVFAGNYQPLLLELQAIAETNEASLGETQELDSAEVMLDFESQVVFLIGLALKISLLCLCSLGLDEVGK